MFNLISFKENGDKIEHIGQKPAFFALTFNDNIVDYFTSLEALKYAYEYCEAYKTEMATKEVTIKYDLILAK